MNIAIILIFLANLKRIQAVKDLSLYWGCNATVGYYFNCVYYMLMSVNVDPASNYSNVPGTIEVANFAPPACYTKEKLEILHEDPGTRELIRVPFANPSPNASIACTNPESPISYKLGFFPQTAKPWENATVTSEMLQGIINCVTYYLSNPHCKITFTSDDAHDQKVKRDWTIAGGVIGGIAAVAILAVVGKILVNRHQERRALLDNVVPPSYATMS